MSSLSQNQKITPFLWFENRAEEAINFYTSIFPNSKINQINFWPEESPFPAGLVQTGSFELDGLRFHAFDAGPMFQFSEAISFFITCKDQEEVDYYWNKLTKGGEESMCGWLKDKFGISWQVVPSFISNKISNGDPEKVGKMMQSLGSMKKLIVADLEKAYNS